MGQKVKEILKKQNKGGKTGTLKSRKKHFLVKFQAMERKEVKEKHRERYGKKVKKMFLVKFQANRMGKEVKEIQKKQNKGVKSGRGVAENIWRGNQ